MKPCVTGCFRLGREMSDRPWRLLVKLRTEQSADELLRAAQKLKTSPDTFANNVFLNPDLSQQQRQLPVAFEARRRKRQKRPTTRQGTPAITPGMGATTLMNTTSNYPSLNNQLPTTTTATTSGHPYSSQRHDFPYPGNHVTSGTSNCLHCKSYLMKRQSFPNET